jgi:hypothetical protein
MVQDTKKLLRITGFRKDLIAKEGLHLLPLVTGRTQERKGAAAALVAAPALRATRSSTEARNG